MTFIFKNYAFDAETNVASFHYGDSQGRVYAERFSFPRSIPTYNQAVFERALFLSFLLIGVSYYKCFPTTDILFETGGLDEWRAAFLNYVYQEGLSQFAYENDLTRADLAHFTPAAGANSKIATDYEGLGTLSLQSGGKDSLLLASLLEKNDHPYTAWYVSSSDSYPKVLDSLNSELLVAKRSIDTPALLQAAKQGGKNGHVPVTFIVLSYAVMQAVLLNKQTVLAAIAHEGDEPHGWIGDLPINHQWSKTWQAETLFAEYVRRYISPDLRVGSPLRAMSELKITQLFSEHSWHRFADEFSSCNVANYKQGANNQTLSWCGLCPKCANAYLLFAPFTTKDELDQHLGGDLFSKSELVDTFKGLLGVDGVMKPFECVGEIGELRAAYHTARQNGYSSLPFEVPVSNFPIDETYPSQDWATAMVQ